MVIPCLCRVFGLLRLGFYAAPSGAAIGGSVIDIQVPHGRHLFTEMYA